ncbi:hypothetical protein CC86DRAFT_406038 [Ophiobolus disseminans]|uniref:Heterokaryon incompatibility domain-containing protein n=1 Tax=Ophiobolus disseminans TaxID=1469910 RepID=A0A6A7A2K4_9PLEO|nr:hypothetical protein CC86DRAFT_406038 [Ophiobolus disseminans]
MFDAWKDVMRLAFHPVPSFTYTPLPPNSIRLLSPCSHPGSQGYSWKLDIVDLEQSDLKFDALSYAWGSQAASYPITCNGQLLHVHYNLYSAMPYLTRRRGNEAVLPIWIDAVCINQGDEKEKMIQIQLMRKLYQRAAMVWVWLGVAQHQHQIPRAIEWLSRIGGMFRKAQLDGVSRHAVAISEGKTLQELESDQSLWSPVMHIINNDWFRRVWIVQEFALARDATFLCGEHKIDYNDVSDAAYGAVFFIPVFDQQDTKIRLFDIRVAAAVFGIRYLVRSRTDAQRAINGLESLIIVCNLVAGTHACLRPEDHVLGLLGLLADEERRSFDVSTLLGYTSLPELYARFSAAMLTSTSINSVYWLQYFVHALESGRTENLPSWVPDLHHLSSRPTSFCLTDKYQEDQDGHNKHKYLASNGRRRHVRKGSRWDQLVFQGKLVDEIETVYPEIPIGPPIPWVQNPDNESSPTIRYYVDVLNWEETLSQVVLGDHGEASAAIPLTSLPRQPISIESYWRTLHFDPKKAGWGQTAINGYLEHRSRSKLFLETAKKSNLTHQYVGKPQLIFESLSSTNLLQLDESILDAYPWVARPSFGRASSH